MIIIFSVISLRTSRTILFAKSGNSIIDTPQILFVVHYICKLSKEISHFPHIYLLFYNYNEIIRRWRESFEKVCFSSLFLFLLVGCQGSSYTPIAKDKNVIITTNIKEGSISFIDKKDKKLITTWELNEPMAGITLLPNGDEILVYGKQLEYMYVYSLAEGRQVGKYKTGKGIVNVVVSADKKQLFAADQNVQKVRFFTINGKETGNVSTGKGPITMVEYQNRLSVLNFMIRN